MVMETPVIIVITGGSMKTELGLRLLACLALGYVLVRPMIAFGMTKDHRINNLKTSLAQW
jgi:hypothetical protein